MTSTTALLAAGERDQPAIRAAAQEHADRILAWCATRADESADIWTWSLTAQQLARVAVLRA